MSYEQATTHVDGQYLVWDTDGYYTFGSDTWKDSIITTQIVYKGGTIGLIPRFDSYISYVAFTITNVSNDGLNGGSSSETGYASLDAFIGTTSTNIAQRNLAVPLSLDQEIEIKSVINRTNYKLYMDGVLIFNVEYNGLNNGAAAIYGIAGTWCLDIKVEADHPTEWSNNAQQVLGSIVTLKQLENDDRYIYIENPSETDEVYIMQEIDVTGATYTLSYNKMGTSKAVVMEVDGASPQMYTFDDGLSEDWVRVSHPVTLALDCTKVWIRITAPGSSNVSINDVQFEQNEFATSYIHNASTEVQSRGTAYVTYPSKNNIVSSTGTISTWINILQAEPGTIFEYGASPNLIALTTDGSNITFQYSGNNVVAAIPLNAWTHVAATWRNDRLRLYVNGLKTELLGIYSFTGGSELIRIGHSSISGEAQYFNGVIDEVIVYSKEMDDEYIAALVAATDPVPKDDQMILRATFDYAIGNFNKSIIEMSPAPMYGTPVIVEKQDGTTMRKVSFFDEVTGEYQTYTEEPVIYDGYSDYIKIAYDNIDTQNYKIKVLDYTGAQYGDPYTVIGRRIYLNLSDQTKKKLKNQTLWAYYQPENAYTVDYNINQPDSFRVSVGKYDGQPLTVTYEGNRFSEEKLATMIEMNPLLNPNHEGFMYITRNKQEVSVFRVKATPSDLPADGISEAVVVIEPLDSNGNFISNAKLEVTTDQTGSSVIPNYDAGSIMQRERAGRYLYRYRVPQLYFKDYNKSEMTDYINIKDRLSGIGVQIPINLVLQNEYYNTETAPTLEEENWEHVAAQLLSVIMDYFQKDASKLPPGLGDILDFDGDGKIDINEIIWLNQYKTTQTLYNKYLEYLSWAALNA